MNQLFNLFVRAVVFRNAQRCFFLDFFNDVRCQIGRKIVRQNQTAFEVFRQGIGDFFNYRRRQFGAIYQTLFDVFALSVFFDDSIICFFVNVGGLVGYQDADFFGTTLDDIFGNFIGQV